MPRSAKIICLSGNIQIIHSPRTVTNATIGGTVTFECGFSGTTESPIWNINGEDYFVSELPPPHVYDGSSMSLIISPVERRMNNSVYYCFFYSEMFVPIFSEHAMLIIQPVINIMSLQLSLSTHRVCCGKTISAHLTSASAATTTTATQFRFSLSHAKSPKLTATSHVQSRVTSTVAVPSIALNLTTITETTSASRPGVWQNLPVQGFY